MAFLSVITPCHDPAYLADAYASLRAQDHDGWEWVVMPTQGAEMPGWLSGDRRIRVVGENPVDDRIGRLKHLAFGEARGEGLVELDSDDWLAPGALRRTSDALDRGAGFAYSDVAVWDDRRRRSFAYHRSHGWTAYPVWIHGRRLWATRCFAPTPRSLCEVYYAPDHLRAWRADVYRELGGHNPELYVGDDHELVCRTYAAGCRLQHVGGCGYVYRYHRANSTYQRYAAISEQVRANRRRYLHAMIERWCRDSGLPVVHWDGGQLPPSSAGWLRASAVADPAAAYRALARHGHLTTETEIPERGEGFRFQQLDRADERREFVAVKGGRQAAVAI